MTTLARNFSGETGCGSPNAHHSFGIRNPEKMNYYSNPSFVPTGPRSYQGNGDARNNRANNNRNGNPSFVPKGRRQYQNNGGARNNRANNNNYNGNGNGNNQWHPRNGNGNHNNQWNSNRNGSGNVSSTDNGTDNSNNHWGNNENFNPNYKGKNFNLNYKGKNFNPNFSRPVPANVGQVRNGNRRNQRNNYNNRQNQPMHAGNYNIDVQMAEAPSDEPNDIEMPDAPPLPDPRIEAFTMGALAVKEFADTMLRIASQLDPNFVPN
ncbi:hypothetical protein N7471_010219 [Penicillium samsonianum]|uniref:uncharacterized protein n=1 Tax=Penicillium samsonianum TaxID=1882272 RepID=UPI002547CC59|nr:uncharacterized protein N7471_010219 [Penicillium samsonianum]KAJ6129002.1 hypothetical protein N7471_010219 [Penicillium samsonianum]